MKILVFFTIALIGPSLGRRQYRRGPPLDVLFQQARDRAQNLQVISGDEVEPHSEPYQVLAGFDDGNGGGWSCGGSLITLNWVLTAGHCVNGSGRSDIILGVHDLSKPETESRQKFSTFDLFLHDDWETAQDIGMVKFDGAELTEYVSLILLPISNDESLVGQVATVYGWGLMKFDPVSPTDSSVLRSGQVSIVDISQCDLEDYAQENICTVPFNGQGPCYGDSGGPLAIDNIVVGIVANGPYDCENGLDDFTRVAGFLDWIYDNIIFN